MGEKDISKEFRPKNINETRDHFFKETKRNKLMIKNKEKVTTLNFIKHIFISTFVVSGCISISDFSSLVDISYRN